MVKVAINGFGRIGRLTLRAIFNEKHDNIDVVAINDLADAKTLAHLFNRDSVHGKFQGTIDSKDNEIIINGKEIKIFNEKNPEDLPWKDLGVEVVIESTGVFRTKDAAEKHLKAGAKKVILSAPPKGEDFIRQIVLGVNQETYNPSEDNIVSNASCTTNCLAPVAFVLNKEFGIDKGYITTIHAATLDQRVLDAPHSDLRRARSSIVNMIPTTTGAAKAVGKVLPELNGKLDGISVRVPTANASVTDIVVNLKKEVSVEEINKKMKEYSEGELKGILEYSEEHLVSTDIIGNSSSSIFDSHQTAVNGSLVKLLSWYDNEYGYSCRIADLVEFITEKGL